MMYEYTVAAAASVVAVVAVEKRWLHTGLFRSASYWYTLGICLFFMVLVNGWLTKLSAPIVQYDPSAKTPWRFPFDIPVEDYLFGFSLVTLVLLFWVRQDTADDPAPWAPEP
ncbi:MAG: lycopene cyclase domain-containing protein [Acidimicrobiales bacterium]|nr:lycopene cyclase domain-containing protein [Acidimicrobiales bacterium]